MGGVKCIVDNGNAKEKKHLTVYKRRSAKYTEHAIFQRDLASEGTSDSAGSEMLHDDTKMVHSRSWVDHGLSSRGRRTSINLKQRLALSCAAQIEVSEASKLTSSLDERDPSKHKGSLCNEGCSPKISIPFSPHGHQSKRVVAPPDFIREQQLKFAEVDSFPLEEETPSPVKYQSLTGSAGTHEIACRSTLHYSSLEAVPENCYEEVPQYTLGDLCPSGNKWVSAALRTPDYASSKQRYSMQSSLSCICPTALQPSTEDATGSNDRPTSASMHKQTDASLVLKSADSSGLVTKLDSLIEGLKSIDIHAKAQQTDNNYVDFTVVIENETNNNTTDCYQVNSLGLDVLHSFDAFMRECGQTALMTLGEVISQFCDINDLVKVGEGTYGEAFKGNNNIVKIVPMDGTFTVNGEIQKTSEEMFDEVLLTNALNNLRFTSTSLLNSSNNCDNFIEMKAVKICQGKYHAKLVDAWEEWDAKHRSENDHPTIFPSEQMYVAFVLADGGVDLERFVLTDFEEVRSLLLQVVLSLAVGEEAYGFEHRDLHWGNVVLARNKDIFTTYKLQGQNLKINNHGIFVSIIDFTLSRIDTGKQVLFCNLSADPTLFEGPKGDLQAETYRRMLEVTGGHWEAECPLVNCLWIHYLADMILTRKTFRCSSKEKRMLRTFRKRMLMYCSARAAVSDEFFEGMFVGGKNS